MDGPLEVAPGVHAFGDDVINFYAVTDGDRLTVIDAGLPGFRERFLADLAELGRTPADVDAVVLTHFDDDHTGLAPLLQEAGARVLIHSADQEKLAKPGPKRGEASLRHVLPSLRKRMMRRIFLHMLRNGGREAGQGRAVGDLRRRGRARGPRSPARHPHARSHLRALRVPARGSRRPGRRRPVDHPPVGHRRQRCDHHDAREINEDNAAVRSSLDIIERVDAEIVLVGHGDPWRHGAAEAARQARG
jgi:ribonuclease BN (tRNA processing enzyme)